MCSLALCAWLRLPRFLLCEFHVFCRDEVTGAFGKGFPAHPHVWPLMSPDANDLGLMPRFSQAHESRTWQPPPHCMLPLHQLIHTLCLVLEALHSPLLFEARPCTRLSSLTGLLFFLLQDLHAATVNPDPSLKEFEGATLRYASLKLR